MPAHSNQLAMFMNSPLSLWSYGSTQSAVSPQFDVWTTPDSINVKANLPGIPKEAIRAYINNYSNSLVIEGGYTPPDHLPVLAATTPSAGSSLCRRIYSHSSFYHAIGMPSTIDAAAITAKFDQDVLTIKVPTTHAASTTAQRLRIPIS
ncbi:hypothetical protein BASA50_004307 [Batrachochytrium salamandrivorans]|uniref:SHSP domain-containing protein n=1 Tax=Batrachochytrium salamandrivorans TaxID=1357716 RepID=A0ABQ8FG09_9FUNG|nr:hypothetical protein BASA60_006117 [Batrachochytrium salamandrivorans]KAH6574023.1 hypothetical protein BASA62_002666 [Batrachochytrium salamandrivorans]KAH6595653.1 hypothetical protein BASA61_003752 [Batrachochytrium salamandrivorans]KAH6597702.1 hypothetical protein BASA50_004307 [Batrachochytrium salamandrivorans]KAH9253842.1 hypothetical protein BASA81_008149 [Batrachochytrium salamandrivorans]